MKCEYCDNIIPNGATSCPSCGAPISTPEKQLSPEQLRQMQKQDALNREKELIQQQMELEKLRQQREEEANVSPCKRSIYILLGLFFGFLGIQFLYARRFYLFALVLACFFLLLADNDAFSAIGGLVLFVSYTAAIFVNIDGNGKKMKWF